MTNRITDKDLSALCARLNKLTNSPPTPYSIKDGADRHTANIGNYHISHAYGGVCLHRMSNESGGVHSVFGHGHGPKRELYGQMQAFIAGIEAAKGA